MCVRRLCIAALVVSGSWVHYIAPPVDKLGHSWFSCLVARLDLLDVEDCGSCCLRFAGSTSAWRVCSGGVRHVNHSCLASPGGYLLNPVAQLDGDNCARYKNDLVQALI